MVRRFNCALSVSCMLHVQGTACAANFLEKTVQLLGPGLGLGSMNLWKSSRLGKSHLSSRCSVLVDRVLGRAAPRTRFHLQQPPAHQRHDTDRKEMRRDPHDEQKQTDTHPAPLTRSSPPRLRAAGTFCTAPYSRSTQENLCGVQTRPFPLTQGGARLTHQ